MRVLRGIVRVLVVVVVLALGATMAGLVVSQTAWFKNRLRGYVVAQGNRYLNGELTIGKLGGSLFTGVHVDDIAVSMNGDPVLQVESLSLDYNLFQLFTRGLSLDEIRLTKPVVFMRRDEHGWSIARLIKRQAQEADREGPGSPMRIDSIAISDGSVVIEDERAADGVRPPDDVRIPRRFDDLDAKLSFAYEPVHYSIEIVHVSFRATEPSIGLNSLSGGIAVRDDTIFLEDLAVRTEETSLSVEGSVEKYLTPSPALNLRVSSDKVALSEIAAIVPALTGVQIQPAFELALDGSLDRLNVMVNVRSSAGQVSGTLVADVASPGQSASGQMAIRHLDLAPILPGADARGHTDLTGQVRFDLRAENFANLDSVEGSVSIDAPRLAGQGYSAENVRANLKVAGRRLVVDARGNAYGATATAAGRVTLPQQDGPVAFDVRGRVRDLNLRRLPATLKAPAAQTAVNADYRAAGTQRFGGASGGRATRVVLNATFGASQLPGLRINAGSRVGIDTRAREIAYHADVDVAEVNLRHLGQAFNLKALAADRYESRFDARVVADGRGTDLQWMTAAAHGTVSRASILGAQAPEVRFDTSIERDVARVTARGSFADLDPAAVSGREAARGSVASRFDASATLNRVSQGVTLDTVDATVRLSLDPSTVGGMALSSGEVDADFARQIAEIRQFALKGVDVNVDARGTLAIGEAGDSNLTFHAHSPRLAEIARLFDVPLEGIGQVDGTITGNRARLRAAGTLAGSGVKYEENGALTLRSTYDIRVPDLEFARATINAETDATFVTLAGQNINEIDAKTTYEAKQVKFDARARQPERAADLAGLLILHPEHQEVHLERLAIRTANQEWHVPEGVDPVIQYGREGREGQEGSARGHASARTVNQSASIGVSSPWARVPNAAAALGWRRWAPTASAEDVGRDWTITVQDFRLESGAQTVTADGTFGRRGDALRVTLENVDLASVDALLLRPPQFTGTLNAAASIEGTRRAPDASGTFHVVKGGFRQFTYESFDGTVQYEGAGLNVDARLQQNPEQWITAKGYVPIAAFRPGSGARVPGHADPVDPADRIDLAIDSSPLGLGLVQGFTTALTDVKGTFEVHAKVTGSTGDPHPSGSIVVTDGALTVQPTGVSYAHIAGRVNLEPDRVRIEQLTVLDDHDSALSLTGDLAVHAREVGDVQLWVTAEDFKVIDNAMGNVRIQTAMEVSGELRKPQIGGWLGVSTGRIDLDEILAVIGTSPYSTKPIEDGSGRESALPSEEELAEPSVFDALRMNVHVTVPDALVVRASDLRAPGSPIGLGALQVTLGGDLNAVKDPAGKVRLVGSVNTVRGTYDFQGRRFEILRDGTVRFDGQDELDPWLDVRTRRIIQGVEARVGVRGRLRQPEVVLSSTPPLEEADVLALIVFNQPLNQLGTGAQIDIAQRAQALAAGALTGQLAQSIGRALHLDTFEISVAPESGSNAELTVGQQVGQNLYVKVQQGFGDTAATNLVVEYAITEWLRLQTNIAQDTSTQQSLFRRNQGTGADLILLFTR